jgi:hypothetical protein
MGNFTLPDFDPTLGTLESVNLTLSLTNCTELNVYNTGSSAASFVNASMTMPGTVIGPGDLTLNSNLQAMLASGTAQAGMNTYSTIKITTTAGKSINSNSLNLWENQSGGVLDFSYTKGSPTYQGTDTGGDSLLFGGTVKGYGKVTVDYTYLAGAGDPPPVPPLATPEPAGKFFSALAASAMALLAFGRKRLFTC